MVTLALATASQIVHILPRFSKTVQPGEDDDEEEKQASQKSHCWL